MTFTVDVSELNQLAVTFTATAGSVGARAAAVVRKTAHDIEGTAKAFCPVDTGNLRSSISTTITGDGRRAGIAAEIGPTAEYGVFVEFGTSRMAPAAFMGPAFDRHAGGLEQALGQIAGL